MCACVHALRLHTRMCMRVSLSHRLLIQTHLLTAWAQILAPFLLRAKSLTVDSSFVPQLYRLYNMNTNGNSQSLW